MVKASQEPVPGDGHRFPARIIETGIGKFGIIIHAIMPETGQIHNVSLD
jgi:hypothetical protein